MNLDRLSEINEQIKVLSKEKTDIQNKCPHTNATFKYKGNYGNYDPDEDHYWAIITCLDCGKIWNMNQNTELFNLIRQNKWKRI